MVAEGSVSSETRWRKMAKVWAPSGVITGIVPDPGSWGHQCDRRDRRGSMVTTCELVGPASEASTANGLLVVRFTPLITRSSWSIETGRRRPTQTDATWELPIAQNDHRGPADDSPRRCRGPTHDDGSIHGVWDVRQGELSRPRTVRIRLVGGGGGGAGNGNGNGSGGTGGPVGPMPRRPS